MTERLNAEEFTESLTGFEEIAIAKHFDGEWTDLAEAKPTLFLRSMVFTDLVRGGQSPTDAKHAVLSMPLREVNDYFPDAEDEALPDDPSTESGKGDAPPAAGPTV